MLRAKRFWLVLGAASLALFTFAGSGSGSAPVLFGGDGVRQTFLGLGGLFICIAGYWWAHSIHSAKRLYKFWVPLIVGGTLLTAGSIVDVPGLSRHLDENAIGGLVMLLVVLYGLYRITIKPFVKRTGQFGAHNQPAKDARRR